MTSIFGKPKVEDLLSDPRFLALAHHLAGASLMASVVLGKKEDPEVQEIGRVLGALASQFDLSRSTIRIETPDTTE